MLFDLLAKVLILRGDGLCATHQAQLVKKLVFS